MKTTLNISESLMRKLKEEAARRGKPMSELVENALRDLLQQKAPAPELLPLPRFDGEGSLVDIAKRDLLYDVMGRG